MDLFAVLNEHVFGMFELWMNFDNGAIMGNVKYFLILAFVMPNHLSNMERHQYYVFKTNFVVQRYLTSILKVASTESAASTKYTSALSFSIVFNVSHISMQHK